MGCDIHPFVENRRDDGTWGPAVLQSAEVEHAVDAAFDTALAFYPALANDPETLRYLLRVEHSGFTVDRNYALFAALNGVRAWELPAQEIPPPLTTPEQGFIAVETMRVHAEVTAGKLAALDVMGHTAPADVLPVLGVTHAELEEYAGHPLPLQPDRLEVLLHHQVSVELMEVFRRRNPDLHSPAVVPLTQALDYNWSCVPGSADFADLLDWVAEELGNPERLRLVFWYDN